MPSFDRKSIRKYGYDYANPGVYFVTVVTKDRVCLFGDVIDNEMHLNDVGRMVDRQWRDLSNRFPWVELDVFVVMPNHVHGILIVDSVESKIRGRAGIKPAPTIRCGNVTIGNMIGMYKSLCVREYIRGVNELGWSMFDQTIWQRNFYEQIVNNIASLEDIREYIQNNPKNWNHDHFCPDG